MVSGGINGKIFECVSHKDWMQGGDALTRELTIGLGIDLGSTGTNSK